MRPLRHLILGETDKVLVEITVRTLHSMFLLRPSTVTNALVIGILAKAQRRYKVDICGYAVLSNHIHLHLALGSTVKLASFMRYVNSNIARKIGKLHGWHQNGEENLSNGEVVLDGCGATVGAGVVEPEI